MMLLTKAPSPSLFSRGFHSRTSRVTPRFSSPFSPPKCWMSQAATSPSSATPKPHTEIPGYRSVEELMADGGPQKMKDLQVKTNQKFGDISFHNLFGFDDVVVNHPQEMLKVFRAEGKYPDGPGKFLRVFSEFMRQYSYSPFVINLDGEEWKRVRTALQKNLFPPEDAEAYLPLINEVSRDISKNFPHHAKNFSPFAAKSTFEMMGNILFAQRLGALDPNTPKKTQKYVEEGLVGFEYLEKVMYWHGTPDPAVKQRMFDSLDYVFKTGGELVKETAEKLNTDPKSVAGSYLGKVMQRPELKFEEIVSNVAAFLFAGIDTTSASLTWLVYNLARFPETQEALHRELKQVLQGRDLTPADIPKLEYLRCTLKENFRLSPAAMGTIRTLSQPIQLMGYEIPAGINITLTSYPIGMKESIFEDPKRFNPGRWDKSLKEKRIASGNTLHDHPLTVLPFSRGSRMCVGSRVAEVELMSIITRLVQDWKFELDPSSAPEDYLNLLTVKLISNPQYNVTPRN